MATIEDEIIALTQQLLNAIGAGDLATYKKLCSPSLTCFEPESHGHLVEGVDFHAFYFDNLTFPAPPSGGKIPPVHNTISSPKVHVLAGGAAAVVAYTRLTQRVAADGRATTTRAEETRVWERAGGTGAWVHVHFHRSITTA